MDIRERTKGTKRGSESRAIESVPEHLADLATVHDFVRRHKVPVKRFERLRHLPRLADQEIDFPSLNEKRLRGWLAAFATCPGPLKLNAPSLDVINMLAELIVRNERALLEVLGCRTHGGLQSSDSSNSVRFDSLRGGFDCVAHATELARHGHHHPAALILEKDFGSRLGHSADEAAKLLPTLLYIQYRYGAADALSSTADRLCKHFANSAALKKADPMLKHLALAQIACALNERGRGADAANIFNAQGVRNLFEDTKGLWPRMQLRRNFGMFHALHGNARDEALACARSACEESNCPEEHLKCSTVEFMAYTSYNRTDFSRAWEAIQPYYKDARSILLHARDTNASSVKDRVHLYSAVFFGFIARDLAKAKYASARECKSDIEALKWCQEHGGYIGCDHSGASYENSSLGALQCEMRKISMKAPLEDLHVASVMRLANFLRR